MKTNNSQNKPKANRIFTDREEPRKIFWDAYETFQSNMEKPNDIKVISYYGIGGIGKTSLLKQLKREMNQRIKKPYSLYVDFQMTADTVHVLKNMRNQLQAEHQFTFPIFDSALYIYLKKIGEDAKLGEIKSQSERRPALGVLLDLSGVIFPGVLGALTSAVKGVDTLICALRNRYENRRIELHELQHDEPDEILKNLPYYFSGDLANNLQGLKEPFVIFLDTYEALVNELSGIGNPLENDDWLRNESRGVIRNVPNVLWVIAGRNKIKWDQIHPEWCEALDQHLLGSLSRNDTRSFLQSAGITDTKMMEDIYALTGGVPVYLDIVVSRYFDMIRRGDAPVIEQFGENTEALVERFVRYMDDSKKDLIYLLSCLDEWTDSLLAELSEKVLKGVSYSTIQKIKSYSFVSSEDHIHYKMHQLIREVLQKECRANMPDLFYKIHSYMVSYYYKELEKIPPISLHFSETLRKYLRCKLRVIRSEDEFCKFFQNQYSKYYFLLKDSYQYSALCIIQQDFAEHCSKTYGHGISVAMAYRTLFDVLLAAGKYKELPYVAQISYDNYKAVLGEEHPDTVHALSNLGRALCSAGRYDGLIGLFEKILQWRMSHYGENHPDTIGTLNDLANTYAKLERYDDALIIEKKTAALCTKVFGVNHPETLKALNNLSNTFCALNQLQDALELSEEVYRMAKDSLSEEDPITLQAMENVSLRYYKLDRFQEAYEISTKALALRMKLLGEEHPDTIYNMANLSLICGKLSKYERQAELSGKVLDLCKKVLGDQHPMTFRVMSLVNSK